MMLILWNRWEQSNAGPRGRQDLQLSRFRRFGGLQFISGDKTGKHVRRPPEEGLEQLCDDKKKKKNTLKCDQ